MSERFDWIRGDALGLDLPTHPDALVAAGPEWLTAAMHAFGSLASHNRITAMSARPCPGGSTGKKLFLDLETLHPEPSLDRTVFAKFSRDFDDERRDWQRTEMEGEAKFVALSRGTQFPIRVPRGHFADYHADTGTGLVITECIAYGEGGIEPHRRKCLDWQTMDVPLPYYRATVTALARLAGAHKSGALAPDIDQQFPFDPVIGSADPIRYQPGGLEAEFGHIRAFARDCPQLMPADLCDLRFIDQLEADAHLIAANEAPIRAFLASNPALVSLNHWNSHIDNCWFWREGGAIHCGLIDWGRVGQITFGTALWGGLSAAHPEIWKDRIDDLLVQFVAEYGAHGGPSVTVIELKRHLALHMALMGVARMLAAPEIIRFRLPQCVDAVSPRDPMFEPVSADPARNYLTIFTNLLRHWQREDIGAQVRGLVG